MKIEVDMENVESALYTLARALEGSTHLRAQAASQMRSAAAYIRTALDLLERQRALDLEAAKNQPPGTMTF